MYTYNNNIHKLHQNENETQPNLKMLAMCHVTQFYAWVLDKRSKLKGFVHL